jgi:anti-sigma regulatory factor (Ser/Thr protein kinase)
MASYELSLDPDIAAIPPLLDWVKTCCGDCGAGEDVAYKIALVLEEAVVNVIEHGFDGRPGPHLLHVRLDADAAVLAAEVTDNGSPFDPASAAPPDLTLPLAERSAGGLGIHLMRAMTDRVEYRRGEDGLNHLRLELRRYAR